jgi:hypothetical protein
MEAGYSPQEIHSAALATTGAFIVNNRLQRAMVNPRDIE